MTTDRRLERTGPCVLTARQIVVNNSTGARLPSSGPEDGGVRG